MKKPYKVYELEKVEGHIPSEIPKKRMIPEVVINPPKRGKVREYQIADTNGVNLFTPRIEKRKGVVVEIPKKLKKN